MALFSMDEHGSFGAADALGDVDEPAEAGGLRTNWSSDEAAHYIGELAGELAGIARVGKLDLLAYLLDMACLEAAKARRVSGGDR